MDGHVGGGGQESADEGMNSITYSGVEFLCSQEGVEPSASQFTAKETVEKCSLAELLKLGRPADEEVRRLWMRRFIADMHWLPLIEVLSGCHPRTDPAAHAAFMTELATRGVTRIAHRPLHQLDRFDWGSRLRGGLRLRVPDPAAWASVYSEGCNSRFKKPHVLFVGDDSVAAAETARPDCLKELPWLFYKAVAVIKGQLDSDGHGIMMFATYGDFPSSEAYWRFIKEGKL